jgi:hypothetical protein
MIEMIAPQRFANEISIVLVTVFGDGKFPVDVRAVAREISKQKYPDDPIRKIEGASLPGFEGALAPAPKGKTGWAIIYNSDVRSRGRINFTLAHEFGHYLLHRQAYPDGFQCSSEDMARWESQYGQLEQEANAFAAALLMPLDDFREQIDSKYRPTLDELGRCAARYDVSLIAATLRWLHYTERRAVLVVSRDGFILWARSSPSALKTGLFFRTRNRSPIPVPDHALAAERSLVTTHTGDATHDEHVWLKEPCKEYVLFSNHFDFTISLLHFRGDQSLWQIDGPEETDMVDEMAKKVSR